MRISPDNFTGVGPRMRLTKPHIVLFYSNGCGHCHDFLPTWKEFVRVSNITAVGLEVSSAPAKLRMELSKSVIKRGVPSVWLYLDGMPYMEYNGDRSLQSLVNFAGNKGNIRFEKVGR